MIEKYNEGETYANIAKCLHTGSQKVSKTLKELGYFKRSQNTVKGWHSSQNFRKHTFDENYFHVIDTEEKAYWLGFLYADGYVDKNANRIILSLQECDLESLETFKMCLNSNYPIQYFKTKIGKKQYYLSFTSAVTKNDLVSHGCVNAKSKIIKPPKLKNDLIHHFIRGYFDGDGSFYCNRKNNRGTVSVLGTNDFVLWVETEFFKYTCGVGNIQIRKAKKNTECMELRSLNTETFINFYNFLYEDAHIFMGRKKEKGEKFINYYHTNCLQGRCEQLYDDICSLWVDGYSLEQISSNLNKSKRTVLKYLRLGSDNGKIEYNYVNKKNSTFQSMKKVKVFKDGMLILEHLGVASLSRNSIDILGIYLETSSIVRACNKGIVYKGYTFDYAS